MFRKQGVEEIHRWRRENDHKPKTSVICGRTVRECYNSNNGGDRNGLLQKSGRHVQTKGRKV